MTSVSALLPLIPVAAAGALATIPAPLPRRRIEQAGSLIILLVVAAMSIMGDGCLQLLVACLAAFGALAEATIPGHPNPMTQAGRQIRLAAILVISFTGNPLLTWLALAAAGVAGAAARLPRIRAALSHLLPGNAALGIALFGIVALELKVVPIGGLALLLGWGTLVLLDPALLPVFVLLAVRLQATLAGGNYAMVVGHLMILAGLTGLLLIAAYLLVRPDSTRRSHLLTLAQGGIVLCALGIGGPDMRFAAVLHLTLLVLSRAALLLSSETGVDRIASVASLSGLPPIGVFPSLALILFGTAVRMPWVLVPMVAGLVAIGWTSATHLPQDASRLRPSAAWLPLAFALLLGIAMPTPVVTWLQAASDVLR